MPRRGKRRFSDHLQRSSLVTDFRFLKALHSQGLQQNLRSQLGHLCRHFLCSQWLRACSVIFQASAGVIRDLDIHGECLKSGAHDLFLILSIYRFRISESMMLFNSAIDNATYSELSKCKAVTGSATCKCTPLLHPSCGLGNKKSFPKAKIFATYLWSLIKVDDLLQYPECPAKPWVQQG